MKAFLRWSQKLTLVSGLMLGTVLAGAAQVMALPQEQVIERLRSVPVFTLANAEGAPLIAVPTQGEQQGPVASVFISRQDAQAFLDQLKARDPQTAEGIQVVPVSLAKIYEFGVNQEEGQEQLRFAFIPNSQQVQAAQTLLQQQGGQDQQFEGVPLFVARSSGEEGGYLTIEQGDQQVIPMFFERAELQTLLDRLKEVQPDLASTVQVQVVNLEGVIQTLQTSDNEELTRIVLMPPQATIDYIRSQQQQNPQGGGQPAGQNRPQGQPARPAQPQAQPNQPQR